jgi:hypothetical protein
MSTHTRSRRTSTRAPASALLEPEQSPVEAFLAASRTPLEDGDPVATQPDEPDVVEDEELEEVTIEPDLPVEPDDGRAEYDRLVASMPPDEPVYVAGLRAPRLKVGAYTLQPGEIVPGAHRWPRREAYERLGRIERK